MMLKSQYQRSSPNFHWFIIRIASLVYFVTAYQSEGYYHPDEHYQIIEFANHKLGNIEAQDLAWEYKARIRPALQPGIAWVIFQVLDYFTVRDPYHQAAFLRMISALLSVFAISVFVKLTLHLVQPKYQRGYILLSYFLWFIPLIGVRFSSETWSGLFFLLSISVFLGNKEKKLWLYALLGILLGLSFLLRFQSALLSFGFIVWLVFVGKEKLNNIVIILTFILLTVQMGIFIDTWFYGEYILTFFNYFYVNIIADVASQFGVSPWYIICWYILKFPTLPIGIIILLAWVILSIKKPLNIFLWSVIPFILIHSIIPHKEERFLFPIVFFMPILLILAWQELPYIARMPKKKLTHYVSYLVLGIIILINVTGIIAGLSKSAGVGRMAISKYIHTQHADTPVNLYALPGSNPYQPWPMLPASFYKEKNLKAIQIHSINELNLLKLNENQKNILVLQKAFLYHNNDQIQLNRVACVKIKQSVPKWIEWLNQLYQGFDNGSILCLYELKNRK